MNAKSIDRTSRYLTFFIPVKSIRRSLRKNVKEFLYNRLKNGAAIKQIEQIVGRQKDICFGIIGVDFRYPLYQRPQHIAASIKKQKRECLYFDDTDISCDCINGIKIYNYTVLFKLPRKVAEKICLILPSGIPIRNFSAGEYIRLRKAGFKIVYEYLDAFDDKISSTDNHLSVFRILKDFPPDFFLATAKRLYNQLRSINKNIPIILNSNGVEIEAFKNVDDSVPNDLQQILANGKKIVGYYGAIAPWLDYELINKVTLALSGINFVFIGCNYNNGLSALKVRENVHYLGVKKYTELPHYSKHFDICIIPFEIGEIAKSTSPLKLFEFMAAGKPCVCTRDLDECKGYDGILIAKDSDDFIEKIKVAMELSKNNTVRERLYEYARINSWGQKAKDIIELVERNTSHELVD